MDGNSPLCSTGLRPLWVRCPASLRVTFKNEKQGMGTADHMISLDYLFGNVTVVVVAIGGGNLVIDKVRTGQRQRPLPVMLPETFLSFEVTNFCKVGYFYTRFGLFFRNLGLYDGEDRFVVCVASVAR